MGNGKSTSGNYLIRQELSESNQKPKKSQQFLALRSSKSVTLKIEKQCLPEINYIDTPGFNDPNDENDNSTLQKVTD